MIIFESLRMRLSCLLVLLGGIVFSMYFDLAHAADQPNAQTFDSNGVKIAYFVQGQGEPVVLIHGWLSSAGINWALPRTSALLAKNYPVIALHVRGHGLSYHPTN